ncbi:uroporphyrinogen-III synthase [Piscinibacter defluvii]|uniref:uroporphyrinogen-III synthase n=1 Tax=Piscinibacter defluvii TaxID=1796922 RepID=UPI000FDE67C0|nr:uroporphyrinogen-III synthase [Piscinibacter defluvii]
MRVLVTRPAAQADDWVQALRARGIDAAALPLIGIDPPEDAAPVRAAWRALAAQRLVVFVSPNAVEQFFALRPEGLAWPAGTLAGSPGPGTTRVLKRLGVPPAAIVEPAGDAAQFDSEALWARLAQHPWRDAAVLIVRGESGRDWLADTLRAHGAVVGFVTAYRRAAPLLDAAQRARLDAALHDPPRHVWLFSSSEAIDRLLALAPGAGAATACAVATHPRIAERARAGGFGAVHACRPEQDAVVACIQSIDPSERRSSSLPP